MTRRSDWHLAVITKHKQTAFGRTICNYDCMRFFGLSDRFESVHFTFT